MIPIQQPVPRTDYPAWTENALVEAARQRDEGAVRELVSRYNSRLFRTARGIVESDADAEEVVQEAYLSAFSQLKKFRSEARFSTWITRIAINAAYTRRRTARPVEEYDTVTESKWTDTEVIAFPGQHRDSAEALAGRSELRDLLEAAVAALPGDLRLVFLLRETEGMSTLEVARELELNPITVKTRLFRARRKLRLTLEKDLRGGFDTVFPFDGARCAYMADRVVDHLRGKDLL